VCTEERSGDRCPGMLLIAGISGVGKTTLVNELIEQLPDKYRRMASVTSRAKREGEVGSEYSHLPKSAICDLDRQGELLNFDIINNEAYGIVKPDLLRTWSMGLTGVKEIALANCGQFQEHCSRVCVVLLRRSQSVVVPHDNRVAVRQETEDLALKIAHAAIDLSYFSSLASTALHLDMILRSFRRMRSHRLPDAREIDALNERTYDRISAVFTEKERPTTHNFHQLSAPFWADLLRMIPSEAELLELGAGRGWLTEILVEGRTGKVVAQDSVAAMVASASPGAQPLLCPIRGIPIPNEQFDWIAASLADGYLYDIALCEIMRILSHGGRLALTYPDRDWVDAFRGGSNRTRFIVGETSLQAYSFTPTKGELESMVTPLGARLIEFSRYSLKNLPSAARLSADLVIEGRPFTGHVLSGAIVQKSES